MATKEQSGDCGLKLMYPAAYVEEWISHNFESLGHKRFDLMFQDMQQYILFSQFQQRHSFFAYDARYVSFKPHYYVEDKSVLRAYEVARNAYMLHSGNVYAGRSKVFKV